MLAIHGRHYENGEPIRIQIEGERIVAVAQGDAERIGQRGEKSVADESFVRFTAV